MEEDNSWNPSEPWGEKTCLRGLITTKAQTSLSLLFPYWKVPYLALLRVKFQFCNSGSLCSWAGWFKSHFVGNPEDRFSHFTAHLSLDSQPYVDWKPPDGISFLHCLQRKNWSSEKEIQYHFGNDNLCPLKIYNRPSWLYSIKLYGKFHWPT